MKKLALITKQILELSALVATILYSAAALSGDRLPYYDSEEFTPQWLQQNSPALDSFHQIPEFEFTNQDGKKVSGRELDNKIYVANFFFTHCPGICPTMQSKLSRVQDAYLSDAQVEIISHSITPSVDSIEKLREYAEENDVVSGKWHLVTGAQDEIYKLAKDAYFASEDLGRAEGNEDFLHTENLLLIDTNKHIRGIYNGLNDSSVSHLIEDIKSLKQEMNSIAISEEPIGQQI